MFKKYNSIENSYRNEIIAKIKSHGFWDQDYIVQEKAHGANISYWTSDGIHFSAGKRTGSIEPTEQFYNFDQVLEEIKPRFQSIWNTLKLKYSDVQQLHFFGELIGGEYPHDKVEPNKKAKKVQSGIYYSPDNHFYGFDILLNREVYLDPIEVSQLFKQENILHAEILFSGNLDSCLAYPNTFESKIPSFFGLPELKPNTCEGVVIRPKQSQFFNGGSRVILKNKNEKWAENKKFHGVISKHDPPSQQVIALQEAIQAYVTMNRLNNVVSKTGVVSPKNFGLVLGMFNKDVVDEFLKDYGSLIEELDKKDLKRIRKAINPLTLALVKEVCN